MTIRYLEPEPFNGTDAALWDIERNPALRTTIVSVLTLDRTIDPDRLTASLDAASRTIPRLRQHVEGAPFGIGVPQWVVSDDFRVENHVRVVTPSDVGIRGALDIATEFATSPFDRTRPLWECAYVEPSVDGPPSIVLKVHHSLVDGIAGVALLDALLDAKRTTPPRDPSELPELRRTPATGSSAVRPPIEPGALVDTSVKLGRTLLDAVSHPLSTTRTIATGGASAIRLLSPSGDVLSPLFTARGAGRHLDVHDVDFDELHDAAARHGRTVNDLFVAAVVEGAAAYHRARSTELDALRVTMPANIRSSSSRSGGNQWVPLRFRAPADIDDPVERMHAMYDVTSRPRREPAMKFSHSLAGAVQLLPSALSSAVVAEMMSGVDLVVTNVPGLSEARYLAGARVDRMYAFAPTGGAAFNVALLSHGSTACLGMMSDTDAVAEPTELHAAIASALDTTIDAAQAAEPTVHDHVQSEPPEPRPSDGANDPTAPRLSALDVAFLQLESADTPMHLGGVFVLDGDPLRDDSGRLRLDELRRHVEARLPRVPAYLRRLERIPFGIHRPVWVDDPDFDIEQHVRAISLDDCVVHDGVGGDLDHAFGLCADLNIERLDRNRPLWELWFVDGLDDGHVVALLKVHHALTDGVGAVELIAALFDLDAHGSSSDDVGTDAPERSADARIPSPARLLADASRDHLRDPVDLARATIGTAVRTPATIARRASVISGGLRDVLGPDAVAPPSTLNRPVGEFRTIAPIALDLDGIDAIRDAHGGTANDVALTVIAGGLRAWLVERGDELPDLHALCPVSQRDTRTGTAHAGHGANHVGAMLISLPLGEADPIRRLAIIRERTERAKRRHDGDGVAWAVDALDHLPGVPGLALRQLLVRQPFANLVVTNIPGPPRPLWFRGARVESIVPVVPLAPNTTLGIALFSYDGWLTIGLHADEEHAPDLELVIDTIATEYDLLQ